MSHLSETRIKLDLILELEKEASIVKVALLSEMAAAALHCHVQVLGSAWGRKARESWHPTIFKEEPMMYSYSTQKTGRCRPGHLEPKLNLFGIG